MKNEINNYLLQQQRNAYIAYMRAEPGKTKEMLAQEFKKARKARHDALFAK